MGMLLKSDRARSWQRGLGLPVRLFLILFIVFAASSWTDLLFKKDEFDRLIGSEHACAMSMAYCSWGHYFLSQTIPSSLAIAAIVALAWRRFPRREAILNTLAIAALVFLAWSVIQVQLNLRAG